MSDVDGALKSKHMKADVDEYLKVIAFIYAELLCCLGPSFYSFGESSLVLCRDQKAHPF